MSKFTPNQKACLSCMECCKYITFTVHSRNVDSDVKMYRLKGCIVTAVYGSDIFLVVPAKCKNLTKKGCSIYESRPQECRIYDGRDDPFFKDICKLSGVLNS